MRLLRHPRGRRAVHRRSVGSRRGGHVVGTSVALASISLLGVVLALDASFLTSSAAAERGLELAGRAIVGLVGSGLVVGWGWWLVSGRVSEVEQELAAWSPSPAVEGAWWEAPSDGELPAAGEVSASPESVPDSARDEESPDHDAGWNADAESPAVADPRGRVAVLQAALDRQTADLRTAQRNLEKERDEARTDERQRVLVAVRALRRLADTTTASPVGDLARVEAVMARLDSPWTAGRPVPALPSPRHTGNAQ